MSQNNLQIKNLGLALQLVIRKLEHQNKSHSSLEAKIGVLLGFVGAIVAGAIVLMNGQLSLLGRNFLTLGLCGLGITLFLLILASRTRIFFDPPDFLTIYSKEALNGSNIDLTSQVIADMKKSYEENMSIHIKKAQFYDAALWAFFISLILIFIGIL